MKHTEHSYKGKPYESESPNEIQENIQQTRAEMNHTLHALERRLSPGQLTDQVLGYFRGAGEESSEFAANLGRSIRDNPVPVTLLGIGLSWLMIAGSEKPERRSSQGYRGPIITPSTATVENGNNYKREQAGQTTSDKIHDRAEQMAHGAREKVEQATETARHQVKHLSDRAHHQAERAKRGFTYMLQEHPLVLGSIGVAVGAVLGAGLPSTRREDELMGGKRDELLEQAEAMGKEQLDKAKHIAETAQEAAQKEAQRQGLIPEAGKEHGQGASSDQGEDRAHRQDSSETVKKETKQQDLGSSSLSSKL
jgi:ElaB/YqjD/DUF883 family membrane-anchored ribosome-binding protein